MLINVFGFVLVNLLMFFGYVFILYFIVWSYFVFN